MTNRADLTAYLDEYLDVRALPDYPAAYNGLQVEGRETVGKIALAVDVCVATLEQTVAHGADMLLVHHGLFWGAKAPIVGPYKTRLALLLKNDLNLYSAHLPLDVHPEVGNNAVLTRLLGLQPSGNWGRYEGLPIGVQADADLNRDELVGRVRHTLEVEPLVIAGGPKRVQRLGILTGGGGSMIGQAHAAGLDTLLTGEGNHHSYFDAEELGVNVIYAGHYATETVGVRALGQHLADRFGLETLFLPHPTGL